MTIQVPVRLTEEDVSALDALIAEGTFKTRSDILRTALAALLHERRERAIEDAYRRGYGKYPQEEWIGRDGLALFAAWDAAEGGDPI